MNNYLNYTKKLSLTKQFYRFLYSSLLGLLMLSMTTLTLLAKTPEAKAIAGSANGSTSLQTELTSEPYNLLASRYDDDDDDDDDKRKHADRGRRGKRGHYGDKGHGGKMGGLGGLVFTDSLMDYDADGNGQLSSTERRAAQSARFAMIDDNGNSSISSNEFISFFSRAAAQGIKASFIILDEDEDKVLSKNEFRSGDKHLERALRKGRDRDDIDFKTLDADSNSELTESEVTTALLKPIERHIKANFIRLDRDASDALSLAEVGSFLIRSKR